MNWSAILLPTHLLISSLIAASIGIYAWRRRLAQGSVAFGFVMLSLAGWCFFYLLELMGSSLTAQIFWLKVKYVPIVIAPASLLVFALDFTRQSRWITRRNLLLLALAPVMTLGFIWTNDHHLLFWKNIESQTFNLLSVLKLTPGPLFLVHAIYLYVLLAASMLVLFRWFRNRGRTTSWRRIRIAAAGIGLPIFASLLVALSRILLLFNGTSTLIVDFPARHLDAIALTLLAPCLLVLWTIKHYNFLEIMPYANQVLIDEMNEGVLVLDHSQRVVYANQATQIALQTIFKHPRLIQKGQTLQSVLADYPDILVTIEDHIEESRHNRSPNPLCTEIEMGEGEHRKYYELYYSQLVDPVNLYLGTLLVWRDVTTRRRAEASKHRRIQELLAVTHISREITSFLDQQQVLDSIVRNAAQISNTGASGLFALRSDGRFDLVAAFGVGEEFINKVNEEGIAAQGTAVGVAIENRRPYQIPDVTKHPGYSVGNLAEMENIHAILALPLLRGEDALGGIVIWDRQVRSFTSEEEIFLQVLANQSVNAIQNARLFEREREQRKLAEVLREIGAELSATLDTDTLMNRLLDQLARLVPYDAASVMIVEGDVARVTFSRGFEKVGEHFYARYQNFAFQINQTANLHWMAENRQPLVIPQVSKYPGWVITDPEYPYKSWAGAPVFLGDTLVAFFSLDNRTPNSFKPEHVEPLAVIAGQAMLAIQNARLFEETQTRLHEVVLLSQIITLTATATDIQTALQQVCNEVAQFYNSNQAIFLLLDASQNQATIIAETQRSDGRAFLGSTISLIKTPVAQQILQSRQPLVVSNVQTDDRFRALRRMIQRAGVVSAIIAPVVLDARVAGILAFGFPEKMKISPADIRLVTNITNQVSQVVHRLRLFTDLQDQAQRMAYLAELSGAMNRPFTPQEVLENIGLGARNLIHADRVAIYVRSSPDTAYCALNQGLSNDYVRFVTEQLAQVPGRSLLTSTAPILVDDILEMAEDELLRLLGQKESYRTLGLWPLVYEGVVIAAIGIYYDQLAPWTDTKKELMLAFSRQAAVALQNAHLFDETNRRAAQQKALNDVIAAAVTALNLADLIEIALDLTMEALQVDKGGIWVAGEHCLRGLPEDIGVSSSNFAQTTQGVMPEQIVVDDWQHLTANHPLFPWAEHLLRYEVRASLVVPVLAGGKRMGALSLSAIQPKKWLADELSLAQAIGRQLGSAAERLELLAKTQQQAQQVQQIIDTVPEGVILLDAGKRIVLANPAARQTLAWLGNENDGQVLNHLAELPIDELLAGAASQSWQVVEITSPFRRVFEVAVRPLQSGEQTSGWVVVLRDVTVERENQTQVQMQERLAMVGQLAAGIAHDFNNIMAAILVYVDLLQMEPNLSTSSRERLGIINQQIQRATSLIRQILDFSRRAIMEEIDLDLLPFIKEIGKLFERVLPEHIRMELVYKPGNYFVKADPTRLQQAFMNLCLNARDAMPGGGALRFELSRITLEESHRLPLPDLLPGKWIAIKVSDTGQGIPAEYLDRVFDPFFTTKPVGQGTGLGLAQVYGIIKRHNGSIDVQSALDQGTTFTIYLPALENEISQEASKEQILLKKGSGETVLVVEDDPTALQAFQTLLESQNYRVVTATNGKQALEVFREYENVIPFLISDVVMPEMDGIALYHALRQQKDTIRCLLITGHPLDLESQVQHEPGRLHWLQKPFSSQELANAIDELLQLD